MARNLVANLFTKVTPEVMNDFKAICAERETTVSQQLRLYVQKYVADYKKAHAL